MRNRLAPLELISWVYTALETGWKYMLIIVSLKFLDLWYFKTFHQLQCLNFCE